MTHICVGNLTIIGPDNGLSPGRHQAIIWTNAGIFLIVPWGTNFSEILLGIQTFSFKKIHLKMTSAKWCPFSLGLNVLNKKMSSYHCEVRAPGPENPMGPLWNFVWGPNGPPNWRIGNVFQWRDPSNFAWGPWKFKWWGPWTLNKKCLPRPLSPQIKKCISCEITSIGILVIKMTWSLYWKFLYW